MRRFLIGGALWLTLALTGLLLLTRPQMPGDSMPPTQPQSLPESHLPRSPAPEKPLYLLVLGVDERPDDPGRSDAMLLVRVHEGQLQALSIPRDTLIQLEGYGREKVNAAYAYGGPALAKQSVAELLGLPVERYLKVNIQGFRHMVDLVGGVPYNVERRMYYVDPADGLVIDLQPGPQVLDGDKAEQYVRFRYDETGDDLSRIKRQQAFMKAAARKALQPNNLVRLPSLLRTALQHVETDLTPTEQIRLAQAAFAAQQAERIASETLPGHGDYVDGISYFLIDREALERILAPWRQPSS